MTRRSRREIEQAVEDLAGGRSTRDGRDGDPPITDEHREAVRSALGWRYDNYDTVDADPTDARALLAEAVEHAPDPHATALRDLLGRGGST